MICSCYTMMAQMLLFGHAIKNFHFAISERPDMSVSLVLPGNLFNNAITHIERMLGRVRVSVEYRADNATRTMGIRRKTLTQKELDLIKHQDIDIDTIISSSYCFLQ